MNRRPLIVASLPVRSLSDIEKARRVVGPDLVELRLDYAESLAEIPVERVATLDRSVIVTIREQSEGGVKPVESRAKARYLLRLHELGVLYDVEASFIESNSVPYEGKIVSAHYLRRLPTESELQSLIERYADRAFCVKIAIQPAPGYRRLLSSALDLGYDNVAVMPLSSDPRERLAFALLGSMLVYTYIEEPTAPGQLRYDDFLKIWRNIEETLSLQQHLER
ncbi:MAG: type I 3-dehydroquinate dehydratase [Acidilobaceae archaeon]